MEGLATEEKCFSRSFGRVAVGGRLERKEGVGLWHRRTMAGHKN